mgnify:CR=1 FL=1
MTRIEAQAFIDAFVKLRGLATDEMSLQVPNLYPVWKVGVGYTAGERVLFNEILYKVLLGHTSQEDWNPEVAPSLFAKVLIPDDNVIPEWEQPDSTNTYKKGDKVTHNGKVWVSTVDNNSWEPGVANTTWEEVTE